MDNFLFKYNLQITFNHPLKLSKTIWDCLTEFPTAKTILDCLTEWFSARQSGIVCPRMLCQDNLQLSAREQSAKTIRNCLTEINCLQDILWLPRQSKIVWPKVLCQDNWIVWPREPLCQDNMIVWPIVNCLTELIIVLRALKLSFCSVLCLQGNLKLSCPCYFVFATLNCLVFQLSYKYKCFAYKYGIASFIFKCSFTL